MPKPPKAADIASHLIYLACPYSDASPSVRISRYLMVTEACGIIHKLGFAVFSPITQWHPVNESYKEHDKLRYEDLLKMDLRIISHCDEVVVLTIPGWNYSTGVQREIAFAASLNITTTFTDLQELHKCLKTFETNLEFRIPQSELVGPKWVTLAQLISKLERAWTDSART